jgi:hypothetical protein
VGFNAIHSDASDVVSTVTTARGDKKNIIRVPLSNTTNLATAINTPSGYYLGLRRKTTTRDTRIELGGNSLISGTGTGWSEAGANDVKGPPRLVVTVEVDDVTHVQQELRYTTSDPTSSQNTPSNSIGGYFAPNEVFTVAQIGDFLSSTDTTITIDDSSVLPSESGIAQVGPEIIKYTGIDTTNRQLTGATRGVAPGGAFPSEIDQYPEYIRYLTVDNLFDKKPSDALRQYRCVAVVHTSSSALNNVTISLVQNDQANVQVDVGIEVPAFDTTTGTATGVIVSGATTFSSTTTSVRNKDTGYYDGGYIIIDPSGTAFEAIIESYDDDGVQATFILDRAMPAFSPAPDFRIASAPAQIVANELIEPNNNSGRFLGFLGDGGESSVGYGSIREQGSTLNQHDAFYLWIKKTLVNNKKATNNTGAVIIIQGT